MYFVSRLLNNDYMKTIEEIHRRNLQSLVREFDGVAAVAAKIGCSPSQFSQWLNGSENSGTGKPRGMRPSSARRIEKACEKPPGWMDQSHETAIDGPVKAQRVMQDEVDDAPAVVGQLKHIPIVGRVQAGPDGMLSIDDYPPGLGDGYMLWWSTCAQAYALRIRGESMSPRYLPSEFVGVDPCADVSPSDEVIVLLKDGTRMIKRLLWRRDDQACFESVNKNFQNIVLDVADIEQLHLVLGNIPKAAFRSE